MSNPLQYPDMKARRDKLRALGLCINGPSPDSKYSRAKVEHGPVVSGGKCARCIEVWNKTKDNTRPLEVSP